MFKYKGLKVKESDAALPKTRKELFKTIVKDDFYLLAELSLLMFLFSLPLAGAFIGEILMIGGAANKDASTVFSICFYCGLIEIPFWGLRYLARYAAFGVMKKRAHNEAGYIKELFFGFLKKGALRGFLAGCVLGLAVFAWQTASVFVIAYNANTWIKGLGIGATTLLFMLAYGAVEYFLSVDNFYRLKFGGALKNGFSFAVMHFPLTLLYFAVTMGLPFGLTLLSTWALLGVAAVFALWGDGLTVLAVTLFSHSLFDKYINSVYYADYINKGLAAQTEPINEKEKDNG
ncbi:MAG: hypothetical protein IK037_04065 [Clostridia bacterium]|nr:hypothetical protein [Clostridia bacterium]